MRAGRVTFSWLRKRLIALTAAIGLAVAGNADNPVTAALTL